MGMVNLYFLLSNRVYNDKLDVVQIYHGHTAVIQSIILVPELSQVQGHFNSLHLLSLLKHAFNFSPSLFDSLFLVFFSSLLSLFLSIPSTYQPVRIIPCVFGTHSSQRRSQRS